MSKREDKRKARYEQLISVGFNSYEANEYKDRSEHVFNELIAQQVRHNERIKEIAKRRHSNAKKG